MAFPFIKMERMMSTFENCFERMAVDPVCGVEPQLREMFVSVVTYYKRFWLQEIGPEKICQYREPIARTTTRKLFLEPSDV